MNSLLTLAFDFFAPLWTDSFFYWYQIPLLLALIAIIVFWLRYRKRQM